VEYKRQVNQSSAARLRSLKTQMSFRLDQGRGTCLYRVGVEDDGCHSLLDYATVAQSCCVLEYLARSLNAVVTERVLIVDEVVAQNDGTFVATTSTESTMVPKRIREPTILGDSMGRRHHISHADSERIQQSTAVRAELTIQKVETHELDPPSLPLSEVNATSSVMTTSTAGSATMEENSTSSSATLGRTNGYNQVSKQDNLSTGETKKTDVGETMSARNIRVAVVGNVDAGKSTLIGVSFQTVYVCQ
jgi:GTPase